MAFAGIGQLVQNISDSVEGLVGLITGQTGSILYPKPADDSVLAKVEKKNWYKSIPYAFSVVVGEMQAGMTPAPFSFLQSGKSDTAKGAAFADFVLPINPSEITQDENFAIHIQPTQGGTAVNHSGNRYKDLVISGTTGIAPKRGAGGIDLNSGRAILQGNDIKAASGFEVFLELRNWLRAYYEWKKNPSNKGARLVFKNFKDGEFLIIEVPKFSMKRSAASPMLYNYTITARVLGQESFIANEKNWAQKLDDYMEFGLNVLTTAQGVLLGAQGILRQISTTYNQVVLEPIRKLGLIYKAGLGVGLTAADVGNDIVNRTMSIPQVFGLASGIKALINSNKNSGSLDPKLASLTSSKASFSLTPVPNKTPSQYLASLPGSSLGALPISLFPAATFGAVQQDQQGALTLPQSYFKDARDGLQDFYNNAADLFNLDAPVYDSIFERTPTLSPSPTSMVTDDQYAVLQALEDSIEAMNLILSTNIFYKSTYPQVIQSVNQSFSDSPNLVADPAVKEIILPGETSLERLALEQLGSAARWIEIVELNGLKPPFISSNPADASQTIKVPGNKILLPKPLSSGFPNIPINDQNFLVQGLSEVQKNLGIDLKLTKDFDLELTNSNDLQIVKAESNAAQAIVFKLSLEKGDLIDHPNLGVGLVVGTKAQNFTEIQTNIIQTLSQDSRFDHIDNLSIQRVGDTFLVNFTIWLKNVDMPVPISIKV